MRNEELHNLHCTQNIIRGDQTHVRWVHGASSGCGWSMASRYRGQLGIY
jgi:hypothetical protein